MIIINMSESNTEREREKFGYSEARSNRASANNRIKNAYLNNLYKNNKKKKRKTFFSLSVFLYEHDVLLV